MVNLLISYKEVKCKEKEIQNSFPKITICLCLLFLCPYVPRSHENNFFN